MPAQLQSLDCHHVDHWRDDARLSDIEGRLCADVRPALGGTIAGHQARTVFRRRALELIRKRSLISSR